MENNRSKSIDKLFDKMDEQTKILYKVDKDIAVLTEKSANYNFRLIAQEKITESLHARVEKLENDLSIMQTKCLANTKELVNIKAIDTEITKLKTHYRWVGGISGFVGWLLGFLLSCINIFKH